MPKTLTGYIVGLYNPTFSGLATVQIAAERLGPGRYRDVYELKVEAGFGVRQIVAMFGGSFLRLMREAPNTLVTVKLDGVLITEVEFAEVPA